MPLYNSVPKARVPRSVFDLSYNVLGTGVMGTIMPVWTQEILPGDIVSYGVNALLRCHPLVSPFVHPVDIHFEAFFVPEELLDADFEKFITGGEDGLDATVLDRYDDASTPVRTAGSLYDWFGCPPTIDPDTAHEPRLALWTAYNLIWNTYYRDQNVDAEVALDQGALLRRRWPKDYYASALPWQQRGTAPALALSGTGNIDASSAVGGAATWTVTTNATSQLMASGASAQLQAALEKQTIDFSDATTFDIADLRLALRTQLILERNARSGARYTEWLRGAFGVSPRDERMERPEYLGGFVTPLITSEVLQTSESGTTDQGNLAGHGIGTERRQVFKFRAKEHGWCLGLMSIIPKAIYQQGLDRHMLRTDRYDFYDPLFAGVSEQAITEAELYLGTSQANNDTVFGYQGAWDEYRWRRSIVVGQLRSDHASTLEHWHLARNFGARPSLNSAFLECSPDTRVFADETDDGFIINWGNRVRAVRPLPAFAVPGGLV